ncbi:MAG: M23 family metallopeptidase, partial [Spirochaetaceae bacterium]
MRSRYRIPVFYLLLLLLPSFALFGRSPYPTIERADRGDPLYLQHQAAVERYFRSSAEGEPLPALRIYEYRLAGERTLHAVAARFNLTVESLATLNRLPTVDIPAGRESVLVPSLPGIFLPTDPETRFEVLLSHERASATAGAPSFPVLLLGESATFRFIPEARLSGAEQRHLLGSFFRVPLDEATVTSHFGYRTHPVFGFRSFHRGVDFRSPRGAHVYAAAAGRVIEVGRDG